MSNISLINTGEHHIGVLLCYTDMAAETLKPIISPLDLVKFHLRIV